MTLSEDNKRLIALGESLDAKVRKAENNVGIWFYQESIICIVVGCNWYHIVKEYWYSKYW